MVLYVVRYVVRYTKYETSRKNLDINIIQRWYQEIHTNMFSRFFKKTSLVAKPSSVDTPMEKFMKEHKTTERVELFLGHTVSESPLSSIHDDEETGTENIEDDSRYFQEAFVDNDTSPCGSYVDVTESKHFDPRDVNTRSDIIATFIRLPLALSLLSVPGIGVKNNNLLEKGGIHNTHQLIGQFLILRNKTTSPGKLADKFYDWLGDIGVHSNRAMITASLAEKIGTWIPGFYDTSVYTLW